MGDYRKFMASFDQPTEKADPKDAEKTVSLPPTQLISDEYRRLLPKRFHPVLLCLSPNQHGQCFKLDNAECILGRSRDVDFLIDDIRASRRHIRITYANYANPNEEPVCHIEDLNSRNGTELNGKPLKERVLLKDHDRVVIGKTVLGFYFRDELEILQQEQLYVSATRDPLTGLLNRHEIDKRLAEELHLVSRMGNDLLLILVDVDHFKKVNDNYGHKTGDAVLCRVAEVLRKCSDERHYVARWGGEEFAVVIPHLPPARGMDQCERLREAVESVHYRTGNEDIRVTASFGMAAANRNDTPETLFKRADKCLYEAKASGRNRVVYRDTGG